MEASKPMRPTQKKNGDQRGWSLGRGLLAQECLTSIHNALKRVCVSERGCAGLRHEEWWEGVEGIWGCSTALSADQHD